MPRSRWLDRSVNDLAKVEKGKRSTERPWKPTFMDLEDGNLTELSELAGGAQRSFDGPEEVFPNLHLSELGHVALISVDAAAGLGELDDADGLLRAGFAAVETTDHVAVEPFRAQDQDDVDYHGPFASASPPSRTRRADDERKEGGGGERTRVFGDDMVNDVVVGVALTDDPGRVDDTSGHLGPFILGQLGGDGDGQARDDRLEHPTMILGRRKSIVIRERQLGRNGRRSRRRTATPPFLDVDDGRERHGRQAAGNGQEPFSRVQIDDQGLASGLGGVAGQDLHQARLSRMIGPHHDDVGTFFAVQRSFSSQTFQRKVHVGVAHHERLLGDIFHLALAGDLELTAMPGIDGRFGTAEAVDLIRCELGAEHLRRAAGDLHGRGRRSAFVSVRMT